MILPLLSWCMYQMLPCMMSLCIINTQSLSPRIVSIGLKDTNSTNKSVRAYAQPASIQCIVKLLDTYMALLPPGYPVFYLGSE